MLFACIVGNLMLILACTVRNLTNTFFRKVKSWKFARGTIVVGIDSYIMQSHACKNFECFKSVLGNIIPPIIYFMMSYT